MNSKEMNCANKGNEYKQYEQKVTISNCFFWKILTKTGTRCTIMAFDIHYESGGAKNNG